MGQQVRFHVYIKYSEKHLNKQLRNTQKRTTVSVDVLMYGAYAIRLGLEPDSKEARSAVIAFAQGVIDEDSGALNFSQRIRDALFESFLDKMVASKVNEWLFSRG
jgi:hypothetical protein